MNATAKSVVTISGISILVVMMMLFVRCGNTLITTPVSVEYIQKFHKQTVQVNSPTIKNALGVALYVDYSTCIVEANKNSTFYADLLSPLVPATTEYWAIKGKQIVQERGDVYMLLSHVANVNYAALEQALADMAMRDGESVLLTDGELFDPSPRSVNSTNPYMCKPFKEWLLKGRDVHILIEPYVETYKGKIYNKKRFYIIFTDDRLAGNIYDRIRGVINWDDYPDVSDYHIGANYPYVVPVAPVANAYLAATRTPGSNQTFEIQDWQVSWKSIERNIVNATMDDDGGTLPLGGKLFGGLRIKKDAFGCFKIADISVKTYNINAIYAKFDSAAGRVNIEPSDFIEIQNFITFDQKMFEKNGEIDLYFDQANYAPSQKDDLNGDPFNYFKIEIAVSEITSVLPSDGILDFDDLMDPTGQRTNHSMTESVKNITREVELKDKLSGMVLYTIYVKSNKY